MIVDGFSQYALGKRRLRPLCRKGNTYVNVLCFPDWRALEQNRVRAFSVNVQRPEGAPPGFPSWVFPWPPSFPSRSSKRIPQTPNLKTICAKVEFATSKLADAKFASATFAEAQCAYATMAKANSAKVSIAKAKSAKAKCA